MKTEGKGKEKGKEKRDERKGRAWSVKVKKEQNGRRVT